MGLLIYSWTLPCGKERITQFFFFFSDADIFQKVMLFHGFRRAQTLKEFTEYIFNPSTLHPPLSTATCGESIGLLLLRPCSMAAPLSGVDSISRTRCPNIRALFMPPRSAVTFPSNLPFQRCILLFPVAF